MPLTDECLLSIENEFLTVEIGRREPSPDQGTVQAFLTQLSRLAPSLPSPTGVANGYGIVYPDPTGHLECAACECDSPYLLPTVVEQQQLLVREAVRRLQAEQGIRLLLSNIAYGGVFEPGKCPTWGAHSNYLVEEHPRDFAEPLLPFLATRIYAGAGVVHFPTGCFLASSRAPFMERETGGGTTNDRAIHSTARDENHMGSRLRRWRLHLISGDPHRSNYNLAVQTGATHAAIKAVLFNPRLPERLPRYCRNGSRPSWTALMQELNVLAEPGHPLRVDRRVIDIQRVYLKGAHEYLAARPAAPAWMPRLLADWEAVLQAMENHDDLWLSQRLDAWAKHALFSQVLAAGGHQWADLPRNPSLFPQLALMDQNYHEFTNSDSVFEVLERQNLLRHRVCAPLSPGAESEPYVPETTTRAKARARFIREHSGSRDFICDWAGIIDTRMRRRYQLNDPFAQEFRVEEGWVEELPFSEFFRSQRHTVWAVLDHVRLDYEHGLYQRADEWLQVLGRRARSDEQSRYHTLRYRAWLRARLGLPDAADCLDTLYRGQPVDLGVVTDYVFVYRFGTLGIDPRIESWIQRGRELLEHAGPSGQEHADAPAFREHLAYVLLRQGQLQEALRTLQPVCGLRRRGLRDPRIHGRILATLGDARRMLGQSLRARRCLRRSELLLRENGYCGELADFAWTELAKLAASREQALDYLAMAKQAQQGSGGRIALARTLLLRARRCRNADAAAETKAELMRLRQDAPSLRSCPLLDRALAHWDQWTLEDNGGGPSDMYWGL